MTNKCIKDLAIVGDTAHIKISEIGTDKVITEFDSPICNLKINDVVEKIKKIREQYDFPVWLIKQALKYYDGDEDKAINELLEIYNAVGDHPDVVVRKNISRFMGKVIKKEVPLPDAEELSKNLRSINY